MITNTDTRPTFTHDLSLENLEAFRTLSDEELARITADVDLDENGVSVRCAVVVLMEREGFKVYNPRMAEPYQAILARCVTPGQTPEMPGMLGFDPAKLGTVRRMRQRIQDVLRDHTRILNPVTRVAPPWVNWRRDSTAEVDAAPQVFQRWHRRVVEVWPGE